MHAIKALYRNGNIELLSPLSAADDTELLILVLDREGRTGIPSETLRRGPSTSEEEFRALGMASFANDSDAPDVDWEEVFDQCLWPAAPGLHARIPAPRHAQASTSCVRVEIPDEEIPDDDIVTDTEETLPTYDLSEFPEDIGREVARMQAIMEMASTMPLPACLNETDSEEQEQRTRAFELRNALRREQGRPV